MPSWVPNTIGTLQFNPVIQSILSTYVHIFPNISCHIMLFISLYDSSVLNGVRACVLAGAGERARVCGRACVR